MAVPSVPGPTPTPTPRPVAPLPNGVSPADFLQNCLASLNAENQDEEFPLKVFTEFFQKVTDTVQSAEL